MDKRVSIKVNARHIGQLGRELVTDYVTALSELVKNSYDADSEVVEVSFINICSGEGKIVIADTGRGFSAEDIEKKWAVVGTNSKVREPYSKKYHRKCVGKKGIGRYSVERLAEYCTLISFSEFAPPVKYFMNWNRYEGINLIEVKQKVAVLKQYEDYESATYLKSALEYCLLSDKIDDDSKQEIQQGILNGQILKFSLFFDQSILNKIESIFYPICEKYIDLEERIEEITNIIEELKEEERLNYYNLLKELYKKGGFEDEEKTYTGTIFILENLRDEWKKKDIEKVSNEFKILISPVNLETDFSLYINAPEYRIYNEKLQNDLLRQKYALVKMNISKTSQNDASRYCLSYQYEDRNQNVFKKNEILDPSYICGELQVTLYYFLRDSSLKYKGLKLSDVRAILDSFCGIKVYRDAFRVRPYGENGNDWLMLDRKKIEDPHTYRVGNNQLIGIVQITSDGNPLLIDATNREAIIENVAFNQLKEVVYKCVRVIEEYRYKEYLEEKKRSVIASEEEERKTEQEIIKNKIEVIQKQFESALNEGCIKTAKEVVNDLISIINTDQQKENQHYRKTKTEYEAKLHDANAELILYKNLAALGIFAGSFGHETDDAIARIMLNIEYPKERLLELCPEDEDIMSAFQDLNMDITRISCYSDLLVAFLKKKKRSEQVNLSFRKVILDIVSFYEVLLNEYRIIIDRQDLQEFTCTLAMKQIDLESIIINIITNAFEALKGKKGPRIIKITTKDEDNKYIIIVEDSGKGVPKPLREWVFIPLNTTKKEDGVGLGLTIVKDIVNSYNGHIHIEDSTLLGGARFVIEFSHQEGN